LIQLFCTRCQRKGELLRTGRTATRITICRISELGFRRRGDAPLVAPWPEHDPPEFATFAPHRRLIVRFHDVIEPQPDQIAPTREDVKRLLVFGREVIDARRSSARALPRRGIALDRSR